MFLDFDEVIFFEVSIVLIGNESLSIESKGLVNFTWVNIRNYSANGT